jgi:hypothetical protein
MAAPGSRHAKIPGDLPDEAGQEFDQASKPEKFIRQCGRRHPSNFIVATKKRDAQNGVLQVNGGREFLPSLDEQKIRIGFKANMLRFS